MYNDVPTKRGHMNESIFEGASKESGAVVSGGGFPDFLEWRKEGAEFIVKVNGSRLYKEGSKKEEQLILDASLLGQTKCKVKGRDKKERNPVANERVSVSCSGLLRYQVENRPESFQVPYRLAVRYKGQDAEKRHQTEVAFLP